MPVPDQIAPCGMNCLICARYLASANNLKEKHVAIPYCPGCRLKKKCAFQNKCKYLKKDSLEFCFECKEFPCENLRKLDARYRTHYRMSMIENLKYMKENGIEEFIRKEKDRWKCDGCGKLISCHNGLCFSCDIIKLQQKKRDKLYRWET